MTIKLKPGDSMFGFCHRKRGEHDCAEARSCGGEGCPISKEMQDAGLVISGTSPDGHLVETVELPGRDFHLGAQFHPEFKSRPNRAHPLFKAFIAAALKFRASEQRSLLHM